FSKAVSLPPVVGGKFRRYVPFFGCMLSGSQLDSSGTNTGRGRQDRFTKREKTTKDIYVYPLEKDFRARLNLPEGAGLGPLGVAEGLDGNNWANQEFGGVRLGDARLSQRLVDIAESKAEKPGRAFTGVAEGD